MAAGGEKEAWTNRLTRAPGGDASSLIRLALMSPLAGSATPTRPCAPTNEPTNLGATPPNTGPPSRSSTTNGTSCGFVLGAGKDRLVLRHIEVVAEDDAVQHRNQRSALAVQDLGGDRDQYPNNLDSRVEEFSKRLTPAIKVTLVSVFGNRGKDGLAVRGHALMDAMHLDRAVDEGVHRHRDEHVDRVNAISDRLRGWRRNRRTRRGRRRVAGRKGARWCIRLGVQRPSHEAR
jgi:hypothetical protein